MKSFFRFLPLVISFVILSAAGASAQKAEPLRVKFAKGKTTATMTGTLSNDQEMYFVFGAKKDQIVKLRVTSVPKGKFFEFGVTGDGFEVETEYDYYDNFSFKVPETSDYYVFMRKRPTERVTSAKFYFVVSIR
jgi:hypothetical protein